MSVFIQSDGDLVIDGNIDLTSSKPVISGVQFVNGGGTIDVQGFQKPKISNVNGATEINVDKFNLKSSERIGTRLGKKFKQPNSRITKDEQGLLNINKLKLSQAELKNLADDKTRYNTEFQIRTICIAARDNDIEKLNKIDEEYTKQQKDLSEAINGKYKNWTPLHFACKMQNRATAKFLVEHGASLDETVGKNNRKPLEFLEDKKFALELQTIHDNLLQDSAASASNETETEVNLETDPAVNPSDDSNTSSERDNSTFPGFKTGFLNRKR